MGIGLDAKTEQRESGPQHFMVMHPVSHPLELELELQFYIKKQAGYKGNGLWTLKKIWSECG